MKHSSELAKAQKAYEKAVAVLDKAMVRETAAWEKLNRAKEVHDKAVMAKVYAAGPGVITPTEHVVCNG